MCAWVPYVFGSFVAIFLLFLEVRNKETAREREIESDIVHFLIEYHRILSLSLQALFHFHSLFFLLCFILTQES